MPLGVQQTAASTQGSSSHGTDKHYSLRSTNYSMRTHGNTQRPGSSGDTDGFVISNSDRASSRFQASPKSAQLTVQLVHPIVTVSVR